MTRSHFFASAASAALIALAAIGGASADNAPSSESMTDPTIGAVKNQQAAAAITQNSIIVVPDGEDYANALPTTLLLPFHIEAEVTKDKWRIKESFIVIGIAPINSGGQIGSCCGSLAEFDPNNYAARVNHDPKKHVDMDGVWTVEVGGNSIATRARNACRDLRKKLAQQGMKHDDIFSQDRPTTLPTPFRYVARVGHRYDNWDLNEEGSSSIEWKQSQPSFANINVTCQKNPSQVGGGGADPTPAPTGSGDLAVGFQINQVALAITPDDYEGACPAKLNLNPTIETNGKGTVKYRFIDQLGNHSQTFQATFGKAEVKFLDHVIEIDAKAKPKGLGFKAAEAQGGELGLAAPSNPDLIQGYFQVETVAPYKKKSNIADYSVKCETPKGPGDIAAGRPDLFIDSVQESPAVPYKIFVKITNQGSVASTPTNLKAIRWTGNLSTTRGTLVPAIQPGQSQVILANLSGTIPGATGLDLRVDDPNRIAEENEGNNEFKVK